MSIRRRIRNRAVRLVVMALLGAVALTGCDFSVYSLPLPGGADLGDNPYKVTIKFRDVLDLVPQSAVKVDDVTVGRVDEIDVDGYAAEVTVLVRGDVKLPGDAEATIRQTSLLGEKFVSLGEPETGSTSSDRLGDGDVIPLARSGRNPEVEEVLGALSLLLNGGGVAQLKMITTELNKALEGREPDVRSVLAQLKVFMGQLDTNKTQIVRAIESLNRLAIAINKQTPTLESALDELPRAVASINSQRDDLVKMLRALSDLSSIGVQVIRDSKAATIDSLQALAPTLTKLAETGDALPKSLQVFLTYPFVDAVVGTNPAQARNLHMGDYTNLSAQLDLDLGKLGPALPTVPTCVNVPGVGKVCAPDVLKCLENPSLGNPACTPDIVREICRRAPGQVGDLCKVVIKPPTLSELQRCINSRNPLSKACKALDPRALFRECTRRGSGSYGTEVCREYRRLPGVGDGGLPLPSVPGTPTLPGTPNLPSLGVNRPGFGSGSARPKAGEPAADSDLGALLVWGMMQR